MRQDMLSSDGSGLALLPFPHLTRHLGKDPGLHLPGDKRLDDGDETAVPGDKGGLPSFFDLAHDACRLLVEITHGVDESLIAINLQCRRFRSCS